ncbi:hypothetical protein HaLaN_08842 [Haematococcus lacustris]|uniref:Uncharacterized protein n=1 Tax=Haematococcus lacustris TaxID=44745 RepID=A0A699YTV5_HAELA|nr:hypothetical protein HaLaN_08842 [Haematococcus lacustris]
MSGPGLARLTRCCAGAGARDPGQRPPLSEPAGGEQAGLAGCSQRGCAGMPRHALPTSVITYSSGPEGRGLRAGGSPQLWSVQGTQRSESAVAPGAWHWAQSGGQGAVRSAGREQGQQQGAGRSAGREQGQQQGGRGSSREHEVGQQAGVRSRQEAAWSWQAGVRGDESGMPCHAWSDQVLLLRPASTQCTHCHCVAGADQQVHHRTQGVTHAVDGQQPSLRAQGTQGMVKLELGLVRNA